MGEGQSQLSSSLTLRAGSPPDLTTGSAVVCCTGGVQDPLSCGLQLVRDRASSVTLPRLGPAFWSVAGSKREGGRASFPHPCHCMADLWGKLVWF